MVMQIVVMQIVQLVERQRAQECKMQRRDARVQMVQLSTS